MPEFVVPDLGDIQVSLSQCKGSIPSRSDVYVAEEEFTRSQEHIDGATKDWGYKVFNDSIHGHVTLPKDVLRFVDTPQFQRLRDLKQLGALYFVFPGASHNRFEHSIGVAHLTGTMFQQLLVRQPALHEEIESRDKYLTQVAGLCHDLGHGPFSHLFDGEVIPRICPHTTWHHEEGSEMLLRHLIKENEIPNISDREIEFMKSLILGQPRPDKPRFLYHIVANPDFGVDVDKFDYIARDCHHLGVKSGSDFSRLMTYCRVINQELCFHAKEATNLYELFHTRYMLHKRIYTHRVAKAIEYMITDALVGAHEVLNLRESILSPERYMKLTDHILKDIENSTQPELEASRKIIYRIRKRKLYRFVDEIIVRPQEEHRLRDRFNVGRKVTEDDILAQYTHSCQDEELTRDDIIINDFKINYGLKDKNPVDRIKFYNSREETFLLGSQDVSMLLPSYFEERIVRIYLREDHAGKVQGARKAFRNFFSNLPFVGEKRPRED